MNAGRAHGSRPRASVAFLHNDTVRAPSSATARGPLERARRRDPGPARVDGPTPPADQASAAFAAVLACPARGSYPARRSTVPVEGHMGCVCSAPATFEAVGWFQPHRGLLRVLDLSVRARGRIRRRLEPRGSSCTTPSVFPPGSRVGRLLKHALRGCSCAARQLEAWLVFVRPMPRWWRRARSLRAARRAELRARARSARGVRVALGGTPVPAGAPRAVA